MAEHKFQFQERDNYILMALKDYGLMIKECLYGGHLTAEERQNFEHDDEEVQKLIDEFTDKVNLNQN